MLNPIAKRSPTSFSCEEWRTSGFRKPNVNGLMLNFSKVINFRRPIISYGRKIQLGVIPFMKKILLLEDALESQFLVQAVLGRDFEILSAECVSAARTLFGAHEFDLMILDLSLPDGSGLDFYASLRENPTFRDVPVIFLTGNPNTDDKVRGFALGADDYLVKPCDPRELRARVDRRITGAEMRQSNLGLLKWEDLLLDSRSLRVEIVRDSGSTKIDLTPTEFRILSHLLTHPAKNCSRQEILLAVQSHGVHVLARTIDKHVCSLREKLHPSSTRIETVFKLGYVIRAAGSKPARKSAFPSLSRS